MELETSWHSYPKVWAMGHAQLGNLLDGPVLVEEKVDGSQFSFGSFGGELRVRSRGVQMQVDAPEKMFGLAVETVKALAGKLKDGGRTGGSTCRSQSTTHWRMTGFRRRTSSSST